MLPLNFAVPMINQLRLGPYDNPSIADEPSQEWLFVERHGSLGEVLFVSDTIPVDGDPSELPPEGLPLRNTIVAQGTDTESGATHDLAGRRNFLIVRHKTTSLDTPGVFFPADGYARLWFQDGLIRLAAFGRHAHSRGESDGVTILHDIPNPAPAASGAAHWHFDAVQVGQ